VDDIEDQDEIASPGSLLVDDRRALMFLTVDQHDDGPLAVEIACAQAIRPANFAKPVGTVGGSGRGYRRTLAG
jgi:hypothetical protein